MNEWLITKNIRVPEFSGNGKHRKFRSFRKLNNKQIHIPRKLTGVPGCVRTVWTDSNIEALQAGLAEKSLRFRTEVKPAKSRKTMTRAWDSIHKANKQIRRAVQCYHLARTALMTLKVSSELLGQYKEIHKEDLKMSRDGIEENRVGQCSSELPWFWRLDRKWDKDRGEFLKECKCC